MESLLGRAWDIGQKACQVVSEAVSAKKTPYGVVEIPLSRLNSPAFRTDATIPGSDDSGKLFRILYENSGRQPIYNVICTLNRAAFSVYRSVNKEEAKSVWLRFQSQDAIVYTIGREKEAFVKLIAVMHEHPNWHAVHYAAQLNSCYYFDCISRDPNVNLQQFLNVASHPEGKFPLHIACECGHLDLVKRLLSLGADASSTDPNKQNAIHYAATCSSNSSVIRELSKSGSYRSCLNNKNGAGYTPLFLAVRNRKPECLEALLGTGATADEPCNGRLPLQELLDGQLDQRSSRCISVLVKNRPSLVVQRESKTGNTPMHRVSNAEVLDALLACFELININERNLEGQTPLHMSVLKGRLQCVVKFLAHGADSNVQDSNGNTALHLAAKAGCLDIVKALLVFGADGTLKNSMGKTATQLLCTDKTIASEIQSCIRLKLGEQSSMQLISAADSGRSLRDCQRLYFRFKETIFRGTRPYDSQILENFLKKEIGVDKSMADIRSRRLTVTTVQADKQPVRLILFRNYRLPLNDVDNDRLGYVSPKEQSLWKAARCSSAAPTYFSNVDGKYVDGGLVANNPTLDLLTEVQNYNMATKYMDKPEEAIELGCVLSVGTGQTPSKPIDADSFNLGLPKDALDALRKAFAAKDLGNLLIDQVTAAEGSPVDRSRAWCNSIGVPYFRFSTPFSQDVPLDETSDIVLIKILWETEVYMHNSRNHVETLIDFLKCNTT